MVAANSMLDVIADGTPGGHALLPVEERVRVANELVARTLDEHAHNEALDSYGPRNKCRRFLTPPTAEVFRQMHEDWLVKADALLERAREMHAAGHSIPQLMDLKVAVASTQLLLQFSAEETRGDVEGIQQGQYHTLEEVRRGLRPQAGK